MALIPWPIRGILNSCGSKQIYSTAIHGAGMLDDQRAIAEYVGQTEAELREYARACLASSARGGRRRNERIMERSWRCELLRTAKNDDIKATMRQFSYLIVVSSGVYSSFGYQSVPRPSGVMSRMAQRGSRSGAPRPSWPGSAISLFISPAQK
jgi:hypothetical protein